MRRFLADLGWATAGLLAWLVLVAIRLWPFSSPADRELADQALAGRRMERRR